MKDNAFYYGRSRKWTVQGYISHKLSAKCHLPRIIAIVTTVRLSPLFGLRIGRERQLKGRQRLHLRIPAIPIISVPSRVVVLSRTVVVAPASMSAIAVIRSLQRWTSAVYMWSVGWHFTVIRWTGCLIHGWIRERRAPITRTCNGMVIRIIREILCTWFGVSSVGLPAGSFGGRR